LAKTKRYSDKTYNTVQSYLLSNSQNIFLWVVLVYQNLEKIQINILKKLELFSSGLDDLYYRIINRVRESEDTELCKKILAIISTVFRSIILQELTSLIELSDDIYNNFNPFEEIVAICGSFLTIQKYTIVFVHQSAKEFLLKKIFREIFSGDIETEYNIIFSRSLDIIFKILQYNILNIKLPGLYPKNICKYSPNPLTAVEYIYIYWIDYFEDSQSIKVSELSIYNRNYIDIFLQQKFLQ